MTACGVHAMPPKGGQRSLRELGTMAWHKGGYRVDVRLSSTCRCVGPWRVSKTFAAKDFHVIRAAPSRDAVPAVVQGLHAASATSLVAVMDAAASASKNAAPAMCCTTTSQGDAATSRELDELKTENEKNKRAIAELRSANRDLQAEKEKNNRTIDEFDDFMAAKETNKRDLDELKAELDKFKPENEKNKRAIAENEKLKDDNEQSIRWIAELKSANGYLQEENDRLNNVNKGLAKQVRELVRDRDDDAGSKRRR